MNRARPPGQPKRSNTAQRLPQAATRSNNLVQLRISRDNLRATRRLLEVMPTLRNILEVLLASHSHFLEDILVRPIRRQPRNTREHARAAHPAETSNVSIEGATTAIKRQTTAAEGTTTADVMDPSAMNPTAEAEATTRLGISPKTKPQLFRHPHLSISQTLSRTSAGPRMCRPRLVTAMTYTSILDPAPLLGFTRRRREGSPLRCNMRGRSFLRCLRYHGSSGDETSCPRYYRNRRSCPRLRRNCIPRGCPGRKLSRGRRPPWSPRCRP